MFFFFSVVFVISTTAFAQGLLCPQNWIYFKPTNSCSAKNDGDFGTDPLPWTLSHHACKNISGHLGNLASIHSSEEEKFVLKTFNDVRTPLWIGLHFVKATYSWAWSDGTPVDYLSWGVGGPGTLKCVALLNTGMYSFDCNFDLYAICKMPASEHFTRKIK